MYLQGENIKPRSTKEARALIGTKVIYLQKRDIDKSGRGYFFPQHGIIAGVNGRNIVIDDPYNYCVYLSDIVEMVREE